MKKYKLRFMFEPGGFCIWGMNNAAKEKYGYAIKNNVLPISNETIIKLDTLESEYANYLDWNEPLNFSLWTKQQKEDFKNKATIVYEELKEELGHEFQIINEVNLSFE